MGWSECKCDPSVLLALGGPFCPDDPNLYRVHEPADTGTVFVLHSALVILASPGQLPSRVAKQKGDSQGQFTFSGLH